MKSESAKVGINTTVPKRRNLTTPTWMPLRRNRSIHSKPASEPIGSNRGPMSPPTKAESSNFGFSSAPMAIMRRPPGFE